MTKKTPSLLLSLIPVLFLIGLLVLCVRVFGDGVSGGPNQVALMTAAIFAALIAMWQGCSWQELQDSILKNISVAMQAILILLIIGGLIGTWILGGIVPALVVWGLKILTPSIFLFATCFVCALVSLATGSSWSTAGTVGLALIGIGHTMGIPMGLTAGAIISGAYFGDKMSPLSDTTNLAPAMAGTDLFSHVRHMVYTTGPSMIISLLLFLIIGFWMDGESYSPERIKQVTDAINGKFNTALYMLIPPVIVIWMVVRKIPAIPALLAGCGMGMLFAVLFQPQAVSEFAGEPNNYALASFKASIWAMANGFKASTGVPEVDSLLSRGGIYNMLSTIWLIMSAMMFGGVMEGSGMLMKIAQSVLKVAYTTGRLVLATIGTSVFMNLTASDQYLAIVITGRMYREAYRDAKLDPKNLSRALEDAGTLTSVLVPWNTCGAFMSTTLGVATTAYLPFCFLNLINPFVSILYGFTGWTMAPLVEGEEEKNRNPEPSAA